ncbi:MAG: cytochrome b/b6 domain-containing protein [Anaerolineae bacterium]
MSKTQEYLRFSLPQRVEHWVMVLSFTVLAITGLPQKFAGDGWAEAMIAGMGGIEFTRVIHHTAAIVLLLGAVYHFVALLYKVYVQRIRWTMFPQLQDVFDAVNSVMYNLGMRKEAPQFDHFSFGEKFEYWALIWGTLVMALSGFVLWNPIITSRVLPGEIIPAAKAAHGAEAILAVLSVLIWHFYNVHIREFNKAMFTGKLTAHQMEEEHPLALALIDKGEPGRTTDPAKIRRRQRIYFPIAAVVSLALLFAVFFFVTAETTAVTTIRRQAGAVVTIYAPQTKTPTPQRAGAPTGGQTSSGIPALPADHAGRTVCQACHDSGIGGAPRSPADHAGRTDVNCKDCHKPAGAAAPATTPTTGNATPTTAATAAATVAATSTTAAATPTTPSGGTVTGPSAQPVDHTGRTVCLACHQTGVSGAKTVPADHAGRTDATCAACHQPANAGTPAGNAPAAGATPTTAGNGNTGGPAAIPADHAGRTICLACHQTGVGGAKAIPADHAGRTDATCQACHKPQ